MEINLVPGRHIRKGDKVLINPTNGVTMVAVVETVTDLSVLWKELEMTNGQVMIVDKGGTYPLVVE